MKERYEVDVNHSVLGFTAKHLGVANVRGRFTGFSGYLDLDGDDVTSASVEIRVDAASIDTGVGQRDDHLRSADFFDAATHPTISFRSTSITAAGDDAFRVEGDLTIRQTTRPITLDVTLEGRTPDPWGGKERLGISASGQINRMDYGLNWNGLAGVVPLASHNIKLNIDLELASKASAEAQS